MDNSFTIDIPEPCAQRWDEMSQTAKGKFCSHCNTEVIDFTQMTTAQVQAYFQHTTQPICGRINTLQLYQLNHPPVLRSHKAGFSLKITMASVMALLVSTKAGAQQVISKPQTVTHLNGTKGKTNGEVNETGIGGTFLVKGTVKSSDDGLALPGANLKLAGMGQSTFTDPNGMFELYVKGTAQQEVTLLITSIGYLDQVLKVKLEPVSKDLIVSLAPDSLVTQHILTGGITAVRCKEVKRPSFFKRMLRHVGGWLE